MLLLIKKHTDLSIEQTKTKPRETLEFKLNKQMETFPFHYQKIFLMKINGYWQ